MEEKLVMKLMELPLTDRGNAERLQLMFGRKWKYLPRYRIWMCREGRCWKGCKTQNMWDAAAEAFRRLAVEIYLLPVPEDEWEQDRRVRVLAWLTRSQLMYHAYLAVRYFREMAGEEKEQAITDAENAPVIFFTTIYKFAIYPPHFLCYNTYWMSVSIYT